MRIPLILVFLGTFFAFGQTVDSIPIPPPVPQLKSNKTILVEIIDICGCGEETHYAGGSRELSTYINKQIKFPSDMEWGGVTQFRAYVYFAVDVDGCISELHVGKSTFEPANRYILEAFRDMPNWIPGEPDCDPVNSYVRVPVTVRLR